MSKLSRTPSSVCGRFCTSLAQWPAEAPSPVGPRAPSVQEAPATGLGAPSPQGWVLFLYGQRNPFPGSNATTTVRPRGPLADTHVFQTLAVHREGLQQPLALNLAASHSASMSKSSPGLCEHPSTAKGPSGNYQGQWRGAERRPGSREARGTIWWWLLLRPSFPGPALLRVLGATSLVPRRSPVRREVEGHLHPGVVCGSSQVFTCRSLGLSTSPWPLNPEHRGEGGSVAVTTD